MILNKRKIGNTSLEVSELGFGGAPIGGWPTLVTEDDAYSTVKAAWDNGIRYFDTAPGYGMSEGLLIEWLNSKNDSSFEIATKWGYEYTANFDPLATNHEVKEHSLRML